MNFYFLEYEETKRLFAILQENGIEARFVGGCVRDAILGLHTDDLDVAVNCEVMRLIDILEKNYVKVIPSGLKYGSIIAILNHKKYELTSLRMDHNCGGRACDVKYIGNFEEDARRRDFTINALYVDADGQLFDYFDGSQDIKNRQIRFIGDAEMRIQEDYLRIFRYYRFCTKYNDYSDRYAAVIARNSGGIEKLSIERIQKELFLILEYSTNINILENMVNSGALKDADLGGYRKLLDIKSKYSLELRLYILFGREALKTQFRLSRLQKKKLKKYEVYEAEPMVYCEYRHGIEFACEINIIQTIKYDLKKREVQRHNFPEFPVKFSDLTWTIERPGELLRLCEKWWVINGYKATLSECLKFCAAQLMEN